MAALPGPGDTLNWRGLQKNGAWEDGPGRAWRGGKKNRGKPQEAARWLRDMEVPVSHVPGFPSHRALAARPDSLVPVFWSPRQAVEFRRGLGVGLPAIRRWT